MNEKSVPNIKLDFQPQTIAYIKSDGYLMIDQPALSQSICISKENIELFVYELSQMVSCLLEA